MTEKREEEDEYAKVKVMWFGMCSFEDWLRGELNRLFFGIPVEA